MVGTSRPRTADRFGFAAWDMAEQAPAALAGPWDAIVHCAADTRWTLSLDDAFAANVRTVEALAPLVSADTHVIHVSTAYATGLRGQAASDDPADYRNTYEWSKAHAERLARKTFPRLSIVRPPLIMGRREDGFAARFAGMYTVLRTLTTSMLPAVVALPEAQFELVPVDDLAALLVELVQGAPSAEVLTIAGGEDAMRVDRGLELIVEALNAWRLERGHEAFPAPRLVTPESWERFFLPFVRDELSLRQRRTLDLLSNFQPYLAVTEPLAPTHPVRDVEACVPASVRYWAESHVRQASLPLRPWKAAA